MSNKTIQELPEVTTTTSTDVLPIVQNNVTSKILVTNLEKSVVVPKLEFCLHAKGFNDQPVVASDQPQQIAFGSAQVSQHVELNGNGLFTFYTAGSYVLDLNFTLARTGAAGGVSSLSIQGVYGNTASNNNYANQLTKLNSASEIRSFNHTLICNVTEAEIISGGGQNTLYFILNRS